MTKLYFGLTDGSPPSISVTHKATRDRLRILDENRFPILYKPYILEDLMIAALVAYLRWLTQEGLMESLKISRHLRSLLMSVIWQ